MMFCLVSPAAHVQAPLEKRTVAVHFQHACHTPAVALTGRQCHTKPDASSLAPVFAVSDPYPLAVVSVLVASLAKVLMMSLAWQEQSSPLSRYGAWTLHSAQAPAMVGSVCPGPLGSLTPKRSAASAPDTIMRTITQADFMTKCCKVASSIGRSGASKTRA